MKKQQLPIFEKDEKKEIVKKVPIFSKTNDIPMGVWFEYINHYNCFNNAWLYYSLKPLRDTKYKIKK